MTPFGIGSGGWDGRYSPFLPILAVTNLVLRSGGILKVRVRQNELSKMESIYIALKGQGNPQRTVRLTETINHFRAFALTASLPGHPSLSYSHGCHEL